MWGPSEFSKVSLAALALSVGLPLAFCKPAAAESWRVKNVVASARVHLRQRPSGRSKIFAYIPGNARGLSGGPCESGWCRIEYQGVTGWVYQDYIAADNAVAASDPAPNAAAGEAPSQPFSVAELATLSKIKLFRLVDTDGEPYPVFAFPNEKLPVAGMLSAETTTVEGLGTCIQSWCYVRSGSLIGWLPIRMFDLDIQEPPPEAVTSAITPGPGRDEANALNKTLTTATSAEIEDTANIPPVTGGDTHLYGLAGLADQASLPIYAEPNAQSSVVAEIPSTAQDVEGLRQCVEQWCRVRWENRIGWVARRHLADKSVEDSQTFQVIGLPLWTPLEVRDSPADDGAVVGTIPSFASGVKPIGGCDRIRCHVRYLGIAGWVSAEHLQPQKR